VKILIKLLVSIKHVDELEDAIYGGADIIDIKDPSKGSLGLPDFEILKNIVTKIKDLNTNNNIEISVAGGDIKSYDYSLKYIAYVVASLNINYFKIGLAMLSRDLAEFISKEISKVLKLFNITKLVLVGYADYSRIESIEPLEIINIAKNVRANVVMIDTYIKDGKSTFNFLSKNYLQEFVKEAHRRGLLTALAGSLKKQHISNAIKLGFDIIGVRGAVCKGNRRGFISKELVEELKRSIKHYSLF